MLLQAQRLLAPLAAVLMATCAAGGCGQQVELAEVVLGTIGESCEASQDCRSTLYCIELVCSENATPVSVVDGGVYIQAMPSRSPAGQGCQRRADCQDGLACIASICTQAEGVLMLSGPQRGSTGDTCRVSNDCHSGLGCVNWTCRSRSLSVPQRVEECHRIECTEDDDCCAGFVQEDRNLCAEIESGCNVGSVSDCNLHRSLCSCKMRCDDSTCVARADCANDDDCGGSGILRCLGGQCAQCNSDSDCPGMGICNAGGCRTGCTADEHCGFFEACTKGRCEHVGCESDRQCQFANDDRDGRCDAGVCKTACDVDTACQAPFHRCSGGFCEFVGCESDAECKAVIFSEVGTASAFAVCRVPVTAEP